MSSEDRVIREIIMDNTTLPVYEAGLQLYQRSNVWEFHAEKDGYYEEIYGVVKGSGRKTYNVDITYNTKCDFLENYGCECSEFFGMNGLCKHCVAVLLEYEKYSRHLQRMQEENRKQQESLSRLRNLKQGMTVQTTPALKGLLVKKGLQRSLPYTQREQWGQVRLQPFLQLNTDGVQLEFKIGITQMYVLKDVFSFVERMKTEEAFSYGKKLSFTHSGGMFDLPSRRFVSFLEKWTEEHYDTYVNPAYYYYGYSYGVPKLRVMPLDGGSLEQFLDALGDGEVCCEELGGGNYYHLEDGELPAKLQLSGKPEGLYLQLQTSLGYRSRNFYICFTDGKIYRTPRSKYESVTDFLQCILEARSEKLFVGKEDLPAFCISLLPELKRVFQCEITDFQEDAYAAEQAKCSVYLDMEGRELVTLKGIASYGTREYLLYDEKTDMEKRDFRKEMEVRNMISQYANAFDYDQKIMVISQDEELLYELLTEGISKLQTVAEVFVSDSLKRLNVVSAPRVTVGVSLSGDLLNLKLTSEEMPREELIEILSHYNRKKKFYRLKNGDFIQTRNSGLDALMELKEGLQLTERQLKQEELALPRYRALFMDEQLKGSKSLKMVRDTNFRSLIKNMKTVEDNDFEIPGSLEHVLREYQKTGFLWIKTLKQNGLGGILADDMGLGKTLQVIAFLLSEYLESEKERKLSLIVTPASLVYNWKSECERFAPELDVCAVVGTSGERKNLLKEVSGRKILITSYDLLKRDVEIYQELVFDYQVIDEAQFIKNQGTQAAKAVKEVQAGFRLALTGTPIENRLSELWSIFDYLMPGFLFSAQRFREEFENRIVKNEDEDALKRIQKMIAPFILRRLKGEVLKDLPEKIEENRYVKLRGEQQKLYDAHVKRLQMMLENKTDADFQSSKIQILAELTKIRQLCCDPALIFEDYKGETAKLELTVQMIQNAVENGHKVLLFSQFTTMLERIQERLIKENISFFSLTGSVSKEKRSQMVESFQTDETAVFCISLKAGGTGLNLTAADIVIHYDPWWNVAAQNQATDRAHRIGQTNMVNVYKIIAKGTIEENIVKLQDRKQELANQILSGSGNGAGSFSREELLELLGN